VIIVALCFAAIVVSVPIIMAVLVSVASWREDRAWSLARPAPGPVRSAARRIVGYHRRLPYLPPDGGPPVV
jgi:hypothetical protein